MSEVTVKSLPPKFIDTTPKRRGRPRKNVTGTPGPAMPPALANAPASAPASANSVRVVFPTPNSKLDEIALPPLGEWDPTMLPDGFFMVLEGKRRTGKSTFAKWLLQYYQDKFSLVWVMSQTAASGYWQKFVGKKFVFDSWKPDAIRKLLKRNDAIIKQWGEDSEIAKKTGASLLILDDCINQDIWSSDEFVKMAVEGRHHLLSVLFITQDPKTIRPMVRDNADVAVVFNQKTFRNKESLWHDFMNDVDKNTALKLISTHCVGHNALVCVQTNLDGDIQKNFFVSTGDKTILEQPDYTLGGPTQKELCFKEREEAKIAERTKRLADKADKRPPEKKVDEDLIASMYTVQQMTGKDK